MKKYLLALLTVAACACCATAQEDFRRGIERETFIPKGQWIGGLSVNFSHSDMDSYQFLVLEGLDGDTHSFKVQPTLLYAIKDDLAIGGKISYKRNRSRIDEAELVLGNDSNYDNENLYSISQGVTAMAVMRNYINLGHQKRFGLYTEEQLEFGYTESKISNGSGTDFTGNFARTYEVGVAIAPGILMFLNNYSALEFNIGLISFGYSYTKQITDQVIVAHIHSKTANLQLNIFSISFGVAFYL